MNSPATLQWTESLPPVDVTSRADLESRLRELANQSTELPIVAIVAFRNDSTGYIGLGRANAILFIHDTCGADGLTPEWISVGDEKRRGESAFWYLGHHSEFENRSLLPTDEAIRGMGELFETGRRPDWIKWERNDF